MDKEITPIKYKEIKKFKDGFAAVKILIEWYKHEKNNNHSFCNNCMYFLFARKCSEL